MNHQSLKWITALIVGLGLVAMARAGAEPRTVVTSFYPMHIAMLNLTRDVPGLKVMNLAAPAVGCLHDFQLGTRDMARLSKAALFVVNGAGMESFMQDVTRRWPALPVIDASRGIKLIETGGEPNAHVWLSVERHIGQVRGIAAGLKAWDPAHAEHYGRNADGYVARLESLRAAVARAARDLKGREIITFHEAFPYLAEDLGLKVVAVIQREPGSEPSAGELAATVRIVRERGVRAVFVEPQYSPKSAEAIARETGVRLVELDPLVSGPLDPEAYLKGMERNLAVLRAVLH